jgi:hypothetical protein
LAASASCTARPVVWTFNYHSWGLGLDLKPRLEVTAASKLPPPAALVRQPRPRRLPFVRQHGRRNHRRASTWPSTCRW